MEKEKLKKLFRLTATNFKFKLDEDFGIFFEMVYAKVQNISDELITKRFQQLWLTTTEEWNKEYGYAGYPSLSDWIKIIAGEKPPTDEEKLEELKEYEKRMEVFSAYIIAWLHQPSISPHRYFLDKYKDEQNSHLKTIINQFAKVSRDLPNEGIIKLASQLKAKYEADKIGFKERLKNIAKEQNPPPFTIEFKPKQTNIIPFPTLKKI
jgi:hypothetical protein